MIAFFQKLNPKQYTELFIELLLLFFFSTLLIIGKKNVYFVVPAILLVAGVWNMVRFPALAINFFKRSYPLTLTFFSYSFCAVLLAFWHQDSFSSIKFHCLPSLLWPVFFLLSLYLCHPRALYYIFPISSWLVALLAIYDKYALHFERALENAQPVIPAAGVAITFSLFCGVFFFERYHDGLRYRLFALSGVITGLIASLLTGSRGAWLCFPVVAIALLTYYRRKIPPYVLHLMIPSMILAVIMMLLLTKSGLLLRLMQLKTDLEWYFLSHNANSSIGLRFEFWKSAWDGFLQHPFSGWGEKGYVTLKDAQYQRGLIIKEALPFVHAHNQFLDAMVKRGIFMFIATCALFLVPLIFFIHYRQRFPMISLLGIILIFNVFTFCLTDSFLNLPLGMIAYMMQLILLLTYFFYRDERC